MTANLELRLKLRLSEVGRWAEAAADPLSMAKKAAREEKIQREKIEREKKRKELLVFSLSQLVDKKP